ncbi:MAG: ferrous iron transport protein A [Clostridia bacterium]|nr:ferrous iron transport protein A [Clostridia bacterium]
MAECEYLHQLKVGQIATVSALYLKDDIKRRLQDIGLVVGTEVECLGRSPFNDPTAYLIRGAVIALRKEDAKGVAVDMKK